MNKKGAESGVAFLDVTLLDVRFFGSYIGIFLGYYAAPRGGGSYNKKTTLDAAKPSQIESTPNTAHSDKAPSADYHKPTSGLSLAFGL